MFQSQTKHHVASLTAVVNIFVTVASALIRQTLIRMVMNAVNSQIVIVYAALVMMVNVKRNQIHHIWEIHVVLIILLDLVDHHTRAQSIHANRTAVALVNPIPARVVGLVMMDCHQQRATVVTIMVIALVNVAHMVNVIHAPAMMIAIKTLNVWIGVVPKMDDALELPIAKLCLAI
jgi:hypothetical protein